MVYQVSQLNGRKPTLEDEREALLLEHRRHAEHDPHGGASALSDVILGGQDGLVNILGIVLGVAAATNDPRLVLVAGLAGALAESVSMGAVAFTATLAEAERYESERQREYRHTLHYPNVEREEIRSIYRNKGFTGDLLERVVNTITADRDVWVSVMLSEEHGLAPSERGQALRSALIVGLSSLTGSLVPLMPFFFLPARPGMWVAMLATALVLFGAGVYKAQVTTGRPAKSGAQMAIIGTLSALAGYLVGLLLKPPG